MYYKNVVIMVIMDAYIFTTGLELVEVTKNRDMD